MRTIRKHSILIAWIISLIATFGSLYFSEIVGFPPCDLCWYQRIFMYPLTIILGIAVFKKSNVVIPYILPLPLIGFSIALYQFILENLPAGDSAFCGPDVSCTAKYIDIFGFITIPFLAMVGFAIIFVLLLIARKK